MHTIDADKLAKALIERHGFGDAIAIVHNRARLISANETFVGGYSESGVYERWCDVKMNMLTMPIYTPT